MRYEKDIKGGEGVFFRLLKRKKNKKDLSVKNEDLEPVQIVLPTQASYDTLRNIINETGTSVLSRFMVDGIEKILAGLGKAFSVSHIMVEYLPNTGYCIIRPIDDRVHTFIRINEENFQLKEIYFKTGDATFMSLITENLSRLLNGPIPLTLSSKCRTEQYETAVYKFETTSLSLSLNFLNIEIQHTKKDVWRRERYYGSLFYIGNCTYSKKEIRVDRENFHLLEEIVPEAFRSELNEIREIVEANNIQEIVITNKVKDWGIANKKLVHPWIFI